MRNAIDYFLQRRRREYFLQQQKGERLGARSKKPPSSATYLILVILFVVAVSATVLLLAFANLQPTGRQSLWEEIGKLCAQFLLLVLLGMLVTGTLEHLKGRQAEIHAARQRKEDHIRRLISLTHAVDHSRLIIKANRTPESWSEEMITRIIPAYTELRDLYHDHATILATGRPFFKNDEEIIHGLEYMAGWFKGLCKEYSQHKYLLFRRMRFKGDQEQVEALWENLQKLPYFLDFMSDFDQVEEPQDVSPSFQRYEEDGHRPSYFRFREAYLDTLTDMRLEFSKADRPPPSSLMSPTVNRSLFRGVQANMDP